MAQFVNIYPCDLRKGPVETSLKHMYLGDVEANRVGVNVTDGGEAVALSGTCSGTAILCNGGTVALTGVISGNQAYIDMPAAVYTVEGPVEIYLAVTTSGVTTTLLHGHGNAVRTDSGIVIDPGTIIPSVAALISDIDAAVASIPEDYSELSADVVQLKSDMEDVQPAVETLEDDVADLKGAINSLEDAIYKDINIGSAYSTNGLISGADGSFASSQYFKASEYIDISEYQDLYLYVTCSLYNASGFAFYNSSKTFISGVSGTSHGANEFCATKVLVPSNAKYIRFSVFTEEKQYSDCSIITDNYISVEGYGTLEEEIQGKYTKPVTGIPASDIASGVIHDPTSIIDDTAGTGDTDKVWSASKTKQEVGDANEAVFETIDTGTAYGTNGLISGDDGTFASSQYFKSSDYIDISDFQERYIYITCSLYASSGFAFYDSSKNYIEGQSGTSHGSNEFCTTRTLVPAHAKYLRFSVYTEEKQYNDCGIAVEKYVADMPTAIVWEVHPVGDGQNVGDTLNVETDLSTYYHGTMNVSDFIGKTLIVNTYCPNTRGACFAVNSSNVILAIYTTENNVSNKPQKLTVQVPENTANLIINCSSYPTRQGYVEGANVPLTEYLDSLSEKVEELAGETQTAEDTALREIEQKVFFDAEPTQNIYCYEEMKSNGLVYLYFAYILIASPTTTTAVFSTIYNAVTSTYQGVSPDGVTCIKLTNGRMLVYDTSDGTFKVIAENAHRYNHVIIALNDNGMLTKGVILDSLNHKRMLDGIGYLEKKSRPNQTIDSYAKRIMSDQTADTMTFMFMTDTHIDTNIHYNDGYLTAIRTIETVGAVSNLCNVVANIHGGDILTIGYTSKEIPYQTLRRFCGAWRGNSRVPAVILRGNHDNNSFGAESGGVQQHNKTVQSYLNETEWFLAAQNPARHDSRIVFDNYSANSGACYIDDEISKIRIICVNTTELPENKVGDEYVHGGGTLPNCALLQGQLNFIADALQFSDKTTPSEWAVLFVSHIPVEMMRKPSDGFEGYSWFGIGDRIANRNLFFGILNAYRNGTTYSGSGCTESESTTSVGTDFEATISVDFTSKGPGEVIGLICGHTHFDNTLDTVGKSGSEEYGYRYICIDAGNLSAAGITVNRQTHTISVRKLAGTVLPSASVISQYGLTQGLFDADLDVNGDWETTYSTYNS